MTFDTFWSIFPRRLNRKQAEKSYNTAIKNGATHEQLARGAQEFRNHVEAAGTEQRFIPHPATWLNQERWTNDYSAENTGHNSRQSQTSLGMAAAVKTVQKNTQAMGSNEPDLDSIFRL
jgi:hypothetical protein